MHGAVMLASILRLSHPVPSARIYGLNGRVGWNYALHRGVRCRL